MALLETAVTHKVAFVPGSAFYPAGDTGSANNSARFNFSNANPDEIREGVRRLAGVVKEVLAPELTVTA